MASFEASTSGLITTAGPLADQRRSCIGNMRRLRFCTSCDRSGHAAERLFINQLPQAGVKA